MKKIRLDLWLLLFLFPAVAFGEKGLVVNLNGARGGWSRETVTNRRALCVDREGEIAEINLAVPEAGDYCLLAYVHHDWRKAYPALHVKATDAKGGIHDGSRAIENEWYLGLDDRGRWFQMALNDNPWWQLPKGNLKIRFWVTGLVSPWEETAAPMESPVAIENLLLVPVLSGARRDSVVSFLNPESSTGNWENIYYDRENATGLTRAAQRGRISLHPLSVPKAGAYKLHLSVRSAVPVPLDAVIYDKNRDRVTKMRIKIKGDKSWQLLSTRPFFIEKGDYTLALETAKDGQVDLDYMILLPQG